MTSAPSRILELIDRFRLDHDRYRRPDFNETQARRELIDPLFLALGWDMDNRHGRGEVRHEDRVVITGKTKAPDYGFRLDGRLRYFVEAKKPSVDLDRHNDSAYQLRRYAWTAKLPLSVLTDFEEFAVYDARVRPQQGDSPRVARLRYWRYTEYEDAWDDIAAIFSREAVLGGSLDAWAADVRGKKGAATVDAEFLTEIERWRDLLARNIALRNPGIDERDLNYAVQQTIDRLLFLRIAEDRGIEHYGRLRNLTTGGDVYSRLFLLYNQADARYNSGLFHFGHERGRGNPDMLTPRLNIDDKALKDIILNLYEPISPYEFSVFPADILGHVYEQFLGKVIRLTGKSARVEEKPEVRKAGGVYYTPTYIVDYIVRQTVGALLEGHAADPTGPVSRLRVLDPACGSGSFLLGAYQFLLDWHLRGYLAAPSKWSKGRNRTLHQTADEEYHLTLAERKRILLDNIYGVDIDPQAVEVTKLSLLLKVVEESPEARSEQATLLAERLLPDLGDNIKCGNSLIGPDFYDGQLGSLIDMGEQMRINAFDWNTEFRDVMSNGGFDAVVGNPPWGADINEGEKPYFRQNYQLHSGKFESYFYFVERAIGLMKHNGVFGFIIPSYWISRSQTEALRNLLFGQLWPTSLIVLPENVFTNVKMDSCIIVASHEQSRTINVSEVERSNLASLSAGKNLDEFCRIVTLSDWNSNSRIRFNPRVWEIDIPILNKIEENARPLGEWVEITQGLTLYRRSTLAQQFGPAKADKIVRERSFHSDHKKDESYKKELLGRDVARYEVNWNGKSWVSYGPWLAHAVDQRFFTGPRLVIQKLRNPVLKQRLVVGLTDDDELYSAGVLLNAIPRDNFRESLLYLIGLLNSHLINYWYRKMILDVSIRVIDLASVPVYPADTAAHDRMVALVEQMLDLHRRLAAEANPQVRTILQRQIDATDRQIDTLVYALYGLTEEEVAIVEDV